jgi:hypothetical protein
MVLETPLLSALCLVHQATPSMDSGDEALPPEDAPTTPTKPEKKSARFADLSGKKQKQNEETHEVRKSASVDATEQQHLDSCKHRRSGCNECTYIKHGHKWGKVLPCLKPDMGSQYGYPPARGGCRRSWNMVGEAAWERVQDRVHSLQDGFRVQMLGAQEPAETSPE